MRNIWTYPLVIILLSGWVGAAIIQVPSEVTTIQKAIDLASAGDTIVVAEGVYSEYLQMQGKDITLTSVMPNDPGAVGRTILQPPAGFTGPVVRFSGAETPACLLDGLTIQKGQDGGIKGSNTHATISRCWIRNNNGNNCGGITAVIGLIDRCRIMGNSGVETGGLLGCGDISNCLIADNSGNVGGVNAGGGTLSNCLIVSNQGKIGASGVGFYSGPILHCTIANNFSSGFAVPGVNVSSPSTISNCIIWGNRTVNAMSVPIIKDVIPPSDPTFSCFSNAPEENGNISADPQLGPGYSLMAGSPCIDAGTNTPPIPLAASDYRGANRVVDGDDAASVVTDMGAIEFDPTGLMVVIQPDRLDFGGTTDGGWSRTQTFEVYNLDGYSGPLQLDTGGASWLTAEPTNGTITQSAQTIAVTVDPTGLAEGEHRGGVMVKVDEDTRMVVDIVLHVGKVIRVPQNSTLIQGAIQMAKDWDTIIMSPGTYKENLDFLGKKIYVRSADPQDWNTVKTTIVDGRCSLPCITFNKGEGRDSIVEGLTLQLGGGNFASYGSVNNIMGGGILCLNSSPTIRRCNVSWNGYGATGGSFPPYTGNWKVYYGGGIALVGACSARIEDCLLIGNLAYSRGSAIYAIGDSSARNEIERCTITDNYFYQSPMGSSFDVDLTGTGASIRNSIVWSTVNQASILISDTDRIQNCLLRYAAVYSGSYSTLIWADVICRNGNLSAGPRFVYPYSSSAPTAYDYRLMADSPCINHGHAGFAGEGQTDLAGNKRVMGGRLDIGAFEFAPEIRVTHPMEGDVWAAGSHHEVIWTEPHIGPVISNSEFGMWYINSIVEGSSTTNDMEVRGWTIGPDSGVDFVPNQIDSIPKYAKTFTAFDRGSGVYQELVDSFGPNTRYTLKLFVGSRKDKAPVTSWQAALTAGDRDTVVAAVTQNQFGNPGLGKWIEVVVTLETGAEGVDPNVGKRIGILLTGAPRVSFVGVSLEAAELAPTATVDVELSTDDGQTWQTIADDVADAGSYSWSIPSDLASEICRILVASERWPDFIWVPGNVFSIRPYEAGAPVESRWPTEGHDMQRMGLAGDNGPELGCVKWQYSTLTPISGNSVLGADERIVVASEGGDLDCLNTDGQLIWKYSTRSPEEHLEGCWMMNDGSGVTAADCLGVRNGSLNNFDASGTSWVEDATFGTVLEFDGVDDYVRIPGFKGISGSQPRVCSAWIQTTQANTDIMMWGSNGASGTRWRIRLQERDGV
ncbi:MAG: hypothetical protein GX455_01760, partial [Phycisphaerae bacterium]|nr:hypothetical protein [Phycisphaerae bacterium]